MVRHAVLSFGASLLRSGDRNFGNTSKFGQQNRRGILLMGFLGLVSQPANGEQQVE